MTGLQARLSNGTRAQQFFFRSNVNGYERKTTRREGDWNQGNVTTGGPDALAVIVCVRRRSVTMDAKFKTTTRILLAFRCLNWWMRWCPERTKWV